MKGSIEREQLAPFDKMYVDRLDGALQAGLPRDFDVWVSRSLDERFYPLCQELAGRTALLDKEKIAQICGDFKRKPLEFPNISLRSSEEYQGLAKFIEVYDSSESREEYMARMEPLKDQSRSHLHDVMDQHLDLSIQGNTSRYAHALNEWFGNRYAIDSYDDFKEHYAGFIPEDPDKRKRFAGAVLIKAAGTKLDDAFPVSHPAQTAISMGVDMFHEDEDFANHFLGDLFRLPRWTDDRTVTEDMLYTAAIMASQVVGLKESAARTTGEAPVFFANEILRAKEVELRLAPLMTLSKCSLALNLNGKHLVICGEKIAWLVPPSG